MLVKVWNDNDYVYEEVFKGDKIKINPKKYIEMDFNEAVQFLGTMNIIKTNKDGRAFPEFYKKLRIDRSTNPVKVELVHKCNMCSQEFDSASELEEHTDLTHLDQLEDQEYAAKRKALGRPKKNP